MILQLLLVRLPTTNPALQLLQPLCLTSLRTFKPLIKSLPPRVSNIPLHIRPHHLSPLMRYHQNNPQSLRLPCPMTRLSSQRLVPLKSSLRLTRCPQLYRTGSRVLGHCLPLWPQEQLTMCPSRLLGHLLGLINLRLKLLLNRLASQVLAKPSQIRHSPRRFRHLL